MNRNVESRFALSPQVDISRSKFDRSHSVKTSFNVGEIIPFYVDEVLPGDTFDVKTSKVVRLQTMITPVMDNMYVDFYYFFVPMRLTWNHTKEFFGENSESAWIPRTEYSIPQIKSPDGGWQVGTLADYFGIPTGVGNLSVNALPFRSYALIINQWFRSQNLMDPLVVPVDDATVDGVNGDNFVTDVSKGGKPFIAAKYHDYFTSALPSPQKGPDVTIPVSSGSALPVVSMSNTVPSSNFPLSPVIFKDVNGNSLPTSSMSRLLNVNNSGQLVHNDTIGGSPTLDSSYATVPVNLWAVDDGSASLATINQLRLAFQIQKLYEADARGGSRYNEIIRSHFGVTSPDARLQIPEYLGGSRVPINVNQIIQQSATGSGDTPQGNPTGLSLTTDTNDDFTKSFTEHGYVIGLMVVRYDHTYQQGLERMWSRKDRFDFYWPVFANIGEQAIKNKEIYAQGNSEDDEVFGYQEAWAEYRYKSNRVSGEMRSVYAQSLDVWHLGDDYSQLPSLSESWIREDKTNVDRVLAVTSTVSNQVFADIYVQNYAVRPLPMYSIPGMTGHY